MASAFRKVNNVTIFIFANHCLFVFCKSFFKISGRSHSNNFTPLKLSKPYEVLKQLTRGNNAITKNSIHEFIHRLKISATLIKELKAVSPHNYTGVE